MRLRRKPIGQQRLTRLVPGAKYVYFIDRPITMQGAQMVQDRFKALGVDVIVVANPR